MRSSFVTGPAGRLRVYDGGTQSASAVLFVHGLAANKSVWSAQLRELKGRQRVVALDLRGHCESDPDASGRYAPADLAQDVAAVVGALALEKIVLVGHSLGGAVVAAFAGAQPKKVRGIFFADPAGDLRKISAEERAVFLGRLTAATYPQASEEWYRGMLAGAAPGVEGTILESLRATPREVVVSTFAAALDFDPGAALAHFEGPMLAATTPDNDQPWSLHHAVPRIARRVIDGTSHWLMMDRPAEFNAVLGEFLAALP